MPKTLQLAISLSLLLALPGFAPAQGEQQRTQQDTAAVGSMPSRGMTKESVRHYFGEPMKRYAPVGAPPISRWQYDGMMVYFEHQYVIHSVATNDEPQ